MREGGEAALGVGSGAITSDLPPPLCGGGSGTVAGAAAQSWAGAPGLEAMLLRAAGERRGVHCVEVWRLLRPRPRACLVWMWRPAGTLVRRPTRTGSGSGSSRRRGCESGVSG